MLKFDLPVSILREGKKFIAFSPALDLSTSGNTHKQARKRFREIIDIFFEELAEKGTLEEVLQELGWERVRRNWNPPLLVSQELQTVKVPAG